MADDWGKMGVSIASVRRACAAELGSPKSRGSNLTWRPVANRAGKLLRRREDQQLPLLMDRRSLVGVTLSKDHHV